MLLIKKYLPQRYVKANLSKNGKENKHHTIINASMFCKTVGGFSATVLRCKLFNEGRC